MTQRLTRARITAVDTRDIRFPTSRRLDGSDAMHPDPDYSAAYVTLRTDAPDGLAGHGFRFTVGRGNEVAVAAKPLWKLPADLTPDQLVALVDFRDLTDAPAPDEILGPAAIRRAVAPVKVAAGEHTANRGVLEQDHSHEHFTDPAMIARGRYTAPSVPGFSSTLRPESLRAYAYPRGAVRLAERAQGVA